MNTNHKGRITQADIARRVNIDQGSVSRILNNDARDSFSEETVRRVIKAARELGYLHPALLSTNRRLGGRKRASLKARIRFVTNNAATFDEGACEVVEISPSGCLLRGFRTKKRSIPMEPFRIDLEINDSVLKNFFSRCRMIRVSDADEEFSLAVQFEGLSEDRKDKLSAFLK
jgi:transcriptional regulator with XRE-family HTH domain